MRRAALFFFLAATAARAQGTPTMPYAKGVIHKADAAAVAAMTATSSCDPTKAPGVLTEDFGNWYVCNGGTGDYDLVLGYRVVTAGGTPGIAAMWGGLGIDLVDSGYAYDYNAGAPIFTMTGNEFLMLTGGGGATPTFKFGTDGTHALVISRDAGTGLVTITTAAGSPTGSFSFGRSVAVTGNVSVTDDAYNSTTWNGSLIVPTKNALRDYLVTLGALAFSNTISTSLLDNDAVTYGKMQNVPQDKLLGRSTASTGDPEEIACDAACRALLDDTSPAAQRATISAAYTLQFWNGQNIAFAPVDAGTYYFGSVNRGSGTTAAQSKMYIRRSGVIRVAEAYWWANGVAGSNEDVSVYVRLNDTTDYLIQTVGAATQERNFTNAAINITVASGDFVEIKMVCPTWATNPTNGAFGGYLLVE